MIQNYKIVTLCGSTRFKEQFIEAQKRLTLDGCIVISVGLFGHYIAFIVFCTFDFLIIFQMSCTLVLSFVF